MAKQLGGGKIQIESGDTLASVYGSNWKQLSGYTGDPTKLKVGTVLPAPKSTLSTQSGYTNNPVTGQSVVNKTPVTSSPTNTNKTLLGQFGGTPDLPTKYNAYSDNSVEQSGVPDYSNVQSIADANKVINQNQKTDIENVNSDGEPATRKSVTDITKEIISAITPKTEKPTANYTESLTEYRTQYGVDQLETQLNDLKTQQEQLYADKQSRINNERGKTVAMNVIEGRVGEVERQENERISAVERSINSVTNQLQTKYNIVDTLMKTRQMDYESASSDYNQEMSTNISIFNTARNISEDAKTEIEREQDTARSNAQIVMNAYTASGKTYDKLSSAEQVTLTKMGVQSGLGADFFVNVLNNSNGKPILTTIVSDDQTTASIIFKDGSKKTMSTGLPTKETSSNKTTDKELLTYHKKNMSVALEKVLGTDGYVTPENWNIAMKSWTNNTPYTSKDFVDNFMAYVNPENKLDYNGFNN